MPKIIIRKGDLPVKKISVPDDILAFTVGSEQGNDIIIPDARISFFHLQFEKQGSEYYVRDLQSQGGTYVNGRKISNRTCLGDHDVIGIGGHTLTFLNPAGASSVDTGYPDNGRHSLSPGSDILDRISGIPNLVNLNAWLEEGSYPGTDKATRLNRQGGFENSMQWLEGANEHAPTDSNNHKPGLDDLSLPNGLAATKEALLDFETPTILRPPESANPEPVTDESSTVVSELEAALQTDSGNYYLLGIYGYYLGERFRLKIPETKIGRDRRLNDIIIKKNSKGEIDQSVSRRQATIQLKNNEYILTDRRSKSRTAVNNRKLEPDEDIKLKPGDEIEIIGDRKSHILRLVIGGNWDFSFPKKAGDWTIRHRLKLLNACSLMLILLASVFFVKSFHTRNIIASRPNPLVVQEELLSSNGSQIANGHQPASSPTYPAMADLDGDGFVDLIYVDEHGVLKSASGKTHDPIWTNDEYRAVAGIPATLADMNQDGVPDVIVVSEDWRLRVLDGSWGIEIWKSPILAGPLLGPAVAADFNGDGLRDLAIASLTNAVYIGYSGLINSRWIKLDVDAQIHGIASAGTFASQALPMITVGTEDGKVLVIDGNRQKVVYEIDINEEFNKATGSFDQNNQIRAPVAYGDLNGDSIQDLVISTLQGNLIVLDGVTQDRLWYDACHADSSFKDPLEHGVVLGDLDGDQRLDVVTIWPEGTLKALKGTGLAKDRKMILWETSAPAGNLFVGRPALADLNKNGTLDVVISDDLGNISIFEGATGERLWQANGSRSALIGSPLVGDVDNDHRLEILALKTDGNFYKFETNCEAIEQSVLWGQIFGNSRNSNQAVFEQPGISKYYANMGISFLVIVSILGFQFFFRNKRKKLSHSIF